MIIPNLEDINFVKFINQQKFKKIIIFSGTNSFYKSGASRIVSLFKKDKILKIVFKEQIIPKSNELKKLIKIFKKFRPNLVIAIGGGTVLDYAKIINIIEDENDLDYKIEKQKLIPKKKNFFLLALPTTAGSGAEVTSNAVIYVRNIKYSIEGEKLKPDAFYLIPELILKNPKKIKSSSGFDAISQAIESLISLKSNQTSVNFARESLKISKKNYINFLNSPTKHNSSSMLIASNLAGKAINISKTTAPHAISYPFTSHFGISHGHAVSLTLNEFLKFNYKNMKFSKSNFDLKNRYKILFSIFKVKDINELDLYLLTLKNKAKLENNFIKLGIKLEYSISKILSELNEQRLKNNPIDVSKRDIKEILINKYKSIKS